MNIAVRKAIKKINHRLETIKVMGVPADKFWTDTLNMLMVFRGHGETPINSPALNPIEAEDM